MFGRYTAHDLKPAAVPDPVLRCAWVFAGTVSGIFAHIVWYSFFFHLWGGTFRFRSLTGRTFWRMRIFFFGRYRDGFRKSFCRCVSFRTGCRLFRFSGRSHGFGVVHIGNAWFGTGRCSGFSHWARTFTGMPVHFWRQIPDWRKIDCDDITGWTERTVKQDQQNNYGHRMQGDGQDKTFYIAVHFRVCTLIWLKFSFLR